MSSHKPSLFSGTFGSYTSFSSTAGSDAPEQEDVPMTDVSSSKTSEVKTIPYSASLSTGVFGQFTVPFIGTSEDEKDARSDFSLDLSVELAKKAKLISGGPPKKGEKLVMTIAMKSVSTKKKKTTTDAAGSSSSSSSSSSTADTSDQPAGDAEEPKPTPLILPKHRGVTLVGRWTVTLELPECDENGTPKQKTVSIFVAQGSVTSYQGNAIVNAANEGCQGGGGVDGAITSAGGPLLAYHREHLPCLPGSRYARCRAGDAVITPSGSTHHRCRLQCDYVVHAVGPNYGALAYRESIESIDSLLVNSYINTLRRCHENNLLVKRLNQDSKHMARYMDYQRGLCADRGEPKVASYLAEPTMIQNIGFSLISSGIFRGSRPLATVLQLGMIGVLQGLQDNWTVDEVYFVAFKDSELSCLMQVTPKVFGSGVTYDRTYEGEVGARKLKKKSSGFGRWFNR